MKFSGRIFLSFCSVLWLAAAVNAATFTVTKTADTNDGTCDMADCSLREAVAAANAAAGDDTIYFALPLFSSPQTITLSGTEIVIAANGSLTINGTGANRLTISGNNQSRIFASSANAVVNIHNLRLTGGNGVGATNTGRGGAVYNVGGTMVITNSVLTGNSAANGGAINNAAATGGIDATLTIINCVLSNNSSTSSGAALQNFSTSTLHMRNTTVNNNTTSGTGIAGAFQANGTVTITNSTFSGNSAPAGTGGGVYFNGSSLIMTNTTIASNSSNTGGGGLHRTGTAATANVRNTIIAGNTGAAATPDVSGAITSQGNNIIGMVGTSTGWVMSDLQNVNPLLAPLGFYGGNGFTHALLSGSPAINAGQNCVVTATCSAANPPAAVNTDQRGAARPFGETVDIGAFEVSNTYRAILPSAQVNQPYNQLLTTNAGSFVYSHSGGALPPGVTVNSGSVSASISGTPTQIGIYNFSVTVENHAMNMSVINYQLNVLSNVSFVPVSGRFSLAANFGASGTIVRLTDVNTGAVYQTRTNAFGYFNFTNIPVGGTYQISIVSKTLIFVPPPPITVVDAMYLEF
ncbi:MAG: CSLREA domain-containing protein [Acidobacteriota bacterium]|nr:CSLREA domain-containing protein [Acidobacteriota bacterium]